MLLYSYRKALCIWNINYMFWAGEQSQDNSLCLCKCIFNIVHSMKLHMNFPPLVLCWQKVWGFKMFQGFSICTKVALTCAIFSPLIKRTLGYTHEAPFVGQLFVTYSISEIIFLSPWSSCSLQWDWGREAPKREYNFEPLIFCCCC